MDQNLKFIISADSSGMRGASEGVKALQDRINGLQTAIQRNARETQYFQGQIDRLNREFKEGRINSIQLSQGIQNYDNAIKKASNETRVLTSQLDKAEREFKQLNITAASSRGSFSNATRGLRSFGAALGLTSGAFLLARGIQESGKQIIEFDQQMTVLASVLGTARGEIEGIERSIRDVASTSVNTITDISKLANILATLGKRDGEIQNLLGPVNNLSIALQASADDAGSLLVQTLNAFGEGSNEAQRYADVIAKMRTSTALDFQKIQVSLSYLAPAADAAGIRFERAGALLGVLADSGIKASRAGRLLSSSLARLSKQGIELDDALQQINNSTNKQVTATQLFGTESYTLGLVLADNVEKISRLTGEFDRAGGSLDKLTNEQLTSVRSRIELAQSAWINFVTAIDNGEGVISNSLRSIADAFAYGLNWWADVIDPPAEAARALDALKKSTEGNFNTQQQLNDAISRASGQIKYFTSEIDKLKDSQDELQKAFDAEDIVFEKDKIRDQYNELQKGIDDYQKRIEYLQNFVANAKITPNIDPSGGDRGNVPQVRQSIPPIQIPIELSGLDTIDFDTVVAIAEQGGERLAQAFRMVQDGVVEMGNAVAPTIDEINAGLQSLQVPEVDYSGIINQVRDIRRYVDPKIFNEFRDQLYGLNEIELKGLKTELGAINIFTGALSDGVNSMVSSMTQSLDTGSKFFDAFVGSILNSLASLVTELITNAITQIAINKAVSTSNSITAASSTAAASGPLGAFVLPGLIAGAVGAIAAAFSGISFAQGGIVPGGSFTGDRVPAWVNSGEMILNNRQQQNLFGMLNGGINASRPQTPDDGIIASTTVRGSDLLLTLERAKRNNRRFGSGINN